MHRPTEILVPTDFSDASKRALEYGAMLAEALAARLHLVHVVADPFDLGWAVDAPDMQKLIDQARYKARQELDRLLTPETCQRVQAQLAVETGSPVSRIVEYATTHSIDLIVIGMHGRGALDGMWLTGAALGVLKRAGCPVVSVPRATFRRSTRPNEHAVRTTMPFSVIARRRPSRREQDQSTNVPQGPARRALTT